MKTPILALIALATPIIAFGFNVNPMVAEFDPQAPRAQQVFVINNSTDTERPIEISVARPVLNDDDSETLEHGVGEENFLIIPQQLLLPPGQRRSVKVFYVGDPINHEETYRIIFRELPVHIPDETELADGETRADVKVVIQYHTRIWVTPKGLREELSITDFEKVEITAPSKRERGQPDLPDETTIPMLSVTVQNSGGKHGYIRQPRVTIQTNDGESLRLTKEDLKNISGQVVLKERAKKLKIPWKSEFPPIDQISDIKLAVAKK